MFSRRQARVSRAKLVRSARAAMACFSEPLERRVLLSNTLSSDVQAVVQDASKVTQVFNEVGTVDKQLASVIGNLPLLGNAMSSAIHGATDNFNKVSTAIQSAMTDLQALGSIQDTDIEQAIFTELGPGKLNVLPASVTSAAQILVGVTGTGSAQVVTLGLDLQGTLFSASLNPQFNLGLPGLGLAVTSGTIAAQATYDIKLNVGIDTTDGFYLDLSANPDVSLKLAVTAPGLHVQGNLGFLQLDATDGTPMPGPTQHTQLVGTISADLSATGNKLTATDLPSLLSSSSLDASAEADVHLHSVLSFGGSAQFPSLAADLDITWSLANASIGSGATISPTFGSEPDIAFNNIQLDIGSFFSKFVAPIVSEVQTVLKPIQPIIDLLNTRMPIFSDIGFLQNLFHADSSGKVTLLNVIDVLFPGSDTTFLNTVVGIDNFINSIPSVASGVMINLGSFDLGGAGNVNGADVRSLTDLTGVNLTTLNASDIASEMTALGNSIGGSVGGQIGGFLGTIADKTVFGGAGGADGGGLAFPILSNPASAFGLLLGQNVDLFTFDTPTLDIKAQLDEFFPILGPLGVELKGTVDSNDTLGEFKAHLDMGYDTAGLVQFATTDHFNPSDVGDLFNGFYVIDDPAKTYAEADLGIGAYASLNIIVASAGVGGGINGDVKLTVNDPTPVDGKLRIPDIVTDLKMSPLCLFDIMGTITASLDAYVKVGFDTPFGFVGWEKDFTLASVTLLDFSAGCNSMPVSSPTLATVLSDGTLRLNMGPYASARGSGDTSDGNEDFSVVPVSTQSNGTETVDVEAFGYIQEYSGVTKIYGEGGAGNDKILVQPGIAVPVELWGDFNPGNPDNHGAYAAGNDTLGASDGPSTLHAGDGNDQVTAGSGASFIYGGSGTDLLVGGAGNDYINAGNGNDKQTFTVDSNGNINGGNPGGLYGNGGNDTLVGGSGNNYMDGGDGNDLITAGSGGSTLLGGAGDDTLTGGSGNDVLIGGIGNDSMDGGPGNDLMLGDDGTFGTGTSGSGTPPNTYNGAVHYTVTLNAGGGSDTMYGGDGNDQMYGGDGNDLMYGGAGDDYVQGNAGNDTLDGGDGNDTLIGGQGNDSMTGDAGNDVMIGDDGDVSLTGAIILNSSATDGNDTMDGGDGNDLMYGQGGNDVMTGDAGNDSMVGGQGNDSMSGGDGNDVMLGDDGMIDPATGAVTLSNSSTDGNDTMDGGNGNDLMYGQGGNDSMTGDAGNDLMVGGQGNDSMDGGSGDDVMVGDDGAIDSLGNVTLSPSTTDGSDSMIGGLGNDAMYGGGGNDIMLGDQGTIDSSGNVALNNTAGDGNDIMDGGAGNDLMYGQGGNDVMTGDEGNDSMVGGQGNDTMDGGAGNDIMLGDDGTIAADGTFTLANSPTDGADSMTGGDGNDEMYGQGGNDTMSGGNGDDNMVGGQGNDLMDGGAGNDAMLGDDGFIARSGTIFNPDGTVRTDGRVITLLSYATDGNDTMTGGDGADTMYGQGGNDSMSGGAGDDDMIGGLGNDTMDGGDGNDVMLGDNGSIITPVNVIPQAVPESNSIARTVVLSNSASDGNDSMTGGNGNDTMYGQGGNDYMEGNAGDDYMEGNAGSDTMYGGAGDDDMIGGSSIAGTPDGSDYMDGGDGNDVMIGDNGTITRPTDATGTHYLRQVAGPTPGTGVGLEDNAVIRNLTLLDEDTIGGNDTMYGGAGDDIMHGGLGDDVMYGGDGNDQMYGELGSDYMDGGTGNDCMLGDKGIIVASIFSGSSQTTIAPPGNKISALINVAGTINYVVTLIDPTNGGNDTMLGGLGNDVMHGGAGDDIMLGDTGMVSATGVVSLLPGGGNDIIFGDNGNDRIYGGDGNDQLFGGAGNDYLDGGLGNDLIYGGDGDDTLIADNGNDRLIDWFGNFNQFVVPGPGFGAPTIVRSPDPHVQDFLLALAAADGATDAQGELVVVVPPSPSNAGPGGGSH